MTPRELIDRWRRVRTGLLTTIAKFSEDELEYVAVQGGYSVATLILHIAHEEEGEIRYGIIRELSEWPAGFPRERYGSLGSIIGLLAEVHERTEAYLGSLDEGAMEREIVTPWGDRYTLGDMLWHVLEHEIHHRGELSLMLGLLGRQGLDA